MELILACAAPLLIWLLVNFLALEGDGPASPGFYKVGGEDWKVV
jgi:hypothetical protein